MVAVNFAPGSSGLDAGQVSQLRSMVATGRRAQRDEFVVVSDGSGGPVQQLRAQRVSHSLSEAGARWVGTSVEPAMATGPNAVVIVRSEYLVGLQQLPDLQPGDHRQPQRGHHRRDRRQLGRRRWCAVAAAAAPAAPRPRPR